ncbi:replication region DNA-binding N-term [Puniceibacterium sediminis]|uniref:Replication region DNA-binding N-term n=1 Tax=Puniceibacterium sediminis TaxID=1608407 RepID=A0A238VMU4_9RHOB|nr:replication region DNA-binding N-term [Puniceibacterium sediminis]
MAAIHTQAEIIRSGEALALELGDDPRPWQIFEKLGKQGKFDRVKKIWEQHRAEQNDAPSHSEIVLPDDAEARIDAGLQALRASMQQLIARLIATQQEEWHRNLSLQQRDHQSEMEKLRGEKANLIQLVDELEKTIIELETKLARAEQPKPAAKPKGQPAARKSPNRAPAKTRQAPPPTASAKKGAPASSTTTD